MIERGVLICLFIWQCYSFHSLFIYANDIFRRTDDTQLHERDLIDVFNKDV
jgi:hypothetical protein